MPVLARVAAAGVALTLVFTACGGGSKPPDSAAKGSNIAGVVYERAPGRTHRKGTIDYQGKHPPSGGDHNPAPVTCGYYDQQPPDEYAVHSLEHGAVWIAYDPSLAAADVAVLKAFAKLDHVLVTPYKGMDTKITLVAWEHRLEVQSASDARIQQFVDTFRNADTAPERGAACVGVGQPAS